MIISENQCQHMPAPLGGKCIRCENPSNAKLQSRFMTSLLENMSKPIKVGKNSNWFGKLLNEVIP